MSNKTKKISIILLCFAFVLSVYAVCYAEAEPFDLDEVLKLEDSIPLNSQKAQDIMEDAFQRSNGAADAYTRDASGLNDYGYDPYALDYGLSYLPDYQLDSYYENLDLFGGDPYAAYDQVIIDEAFSTPAAAVALDMYGPDGIGYAEEDGFDIYGGL